jgi:hypothetical protein
MAADIDRVIDSYITDVLLEEDPGDPEGMYWWWPRAAWVDPNQLIVDAGDSLRRVEFTTNDRQEITFKTPVEVLEQFIDLAPSAKAHVLVAAAQDTRPRSAMRVFESRDEVPGLPQKDPEAGVQDPGNNVGMDPELIRAALGLSADATDEQVQAAAEARKAELDAAEDDGTGNGGNEGEGGEGSGSGEGEGAPAEEGAGSEGGEATPPAAAASGPRPGMVEVPEDTWAEVQEGAAAGTKVAAAAETKRRDDTIAQACADGKIKPSATESMENLHERDPKSFYNLLTASVDKGGLAKNLVPVHQQGGAGPEAAASTTAPSPAKMKAMFPEVAFAGSES